MNLDLWPTLVNLGIGVRRARPVLGLGILALALGAAGLLWVHGPRAQEEARLRDTLRSAGAQLRGMPNERLVPVDPGAQALADLVDRLGDPSQAATYLQRIFAVARQSELDVAQAEYRWQVDEAAMSERLVLQLTVSGSYQALRGFLDQVLAQLHFASLDECSVRRDAISDGTVSANLRISMHFKPGAATAEAARRNAAPSASAARPPSQRRSP